MIEFKPQNNRIGPNGHDAFLGKWLVGSVAFDSVHREDPPYSARCRLPGIKDVLGRFDSEAEARARLTRAVDRWIKEAGLVVSPVSEDATVAGITEQW